MSHLPQEQSKNISKFALGDTSLLWHLDGDQKRVSIQMLSDSMNLFSKMVQVSVSWAAANQPQQFNSN